jgi:hypothetical protein
VALALFASASQAFACDWNHEAEAAVKDTVVADCINANCKAVPDVSDKSAKNSVPAATSGDSVQPAPASTVAVIKQ